jgi:hypothetical protein
MAPPFGRILASVPDYGTGVLRSKTPPARLWQAGSMDAAGSTALECPDKWTEATRGLEMITNFCYFNISSL